MVGAVAKFFCFKSYLAVVVMAVLVGLSGCRSVPSAPTAGDVPEGGAEKKVSSATGAGGGATGGSSVAERESFAASPASVETMELEREMAATLAAAEGGKAASAAEDAADAADAVELAKEDTPLLEPGSRRPTRWEGEYRVAIVSEPAGAMVVVDGIPVGNTPRRIILPGTEQGFLKRPVSVRVRFVAGSAAATSKTVEVRLTPLERTPQRIEFTPAGARRVLPEKG